ncbi:MAG: outer membrane beta-barrel protein, partial [Planctomycetota bacterium]|nr:outer membrane beta-barrel protein [Planctomycetota bacterium]
TQGGNYYNITLGLNWKPRPNLIVRPEIRWDKTDTWIRTPPGQASLFDDFGDQDQFTFALDVILLL